jgi:hypothetical protein
MILFVRKVLVIVVFVYTDPMTNTLTPLFQADDNLFLDLAALNIVRFETKGQNATAHLKFKDGGSETIHGESAHSLQQRLAALSKVDESESSLAEHDLSDVAAHDSPSHPVHIDLTTAPLLGRNKAWFYGKDKSGRGLILAFVNAKGSCSVRPFDGETSIALGRRYGSGPYQEHFADLIEGATELTVDSQPNLERDCKQRLPERLFAHLKKQIEQVG